MNKEFFWIDAFTSKAFCGNPCAVFLGADELSEVNMQNLAKEINLSETAFVFSSKRADFKARYFTPVYELPFAGHPTIAVVHALAEASMISLDNGKATIQLEVPAGIIPVRLQKHNDFSQVTMSQLKPEFLRTYEPGVIAAVFGIRPNDILENVPVQTVSTGTPILMIPLKSHEALKRVRHSDLKAYKLLKDQGDFFFPHHFVVQGMTSEGKTFARSLTPPPENEDPFTGSATGCMAAYLWNYRLISKSNFIAQQGHWMGRPGHAEVEVIGAPDDIERVDLTGAARTIFSGRVTLGSI